MASTYTAKNGACVEVGSNATWKWIITVTPTKGDPDSLKDKGEPSMQAVSTFLGNYGAVDVASVVISEIIASENRH